jgi:hypothetical protein
MTNGDEEKSKRISESKRIGHKKRKLNAMLSRVDEDTLYGISDLVENAAFIAVRLDDIRKGPNPDMKRYGELMRMYQNIQKQLLIAVRNASPTTDADEFAAFDVEYSDE